MKKTNLFIFDDLTDKRLAVLSNKENDLLPYFNDEVIEQLNRDYTFEFTVPMAHKDSKYLVKGNRVVYQDKDGDFQEFQIYKTEEENGTSEPRIVVFAEHSHYELLDDIVEDSRVRDGEVAVAMQRALSASRWQVGQVDSLGKGTVNFYFSNAMNNLTRVQETYGGELRFRVGLNENKTAIKDRFVDLLVRRGSDTGKRSEYTKDIVSIKRTTDMSGIKTALFGQGTGEETENNGYSRKPTFEHIEWNPNNGDPVLKPLGQKWVGDPDALARYGREGGKRHRFGTFDVDSTDPETVLIETYKELQKVKTPRITYEVQGQDLEFIGLTHEAVRLGDSIYIIDKTFNPELRIEARVVEIKQSLSDPSNIEIILGNFIPLFTDLAYELDELKAQFTDRKGVWNKVEDIEVGDITDGSIEDVVPRVPTNVGVTSMFRSLAVEWDFDPSLYISAYEVYGSTTRGFTVDSSNLLFRGKTGGYVHVGKTNETWYFRVRAINTHGKFSPLSSEVNGSTLRIETPDYEDLSIVGAKIADLAVDGAKIARASITDAHINSLNVNKVNAGVLKAQFIEIGSRTVYQNGYDPKKNKDEAITESVNQAVPEAVKQANEYARPSVTTILDSDFEYDGRFWTSSVVDGVVESPSIPNESRFRFVNSNESNRGNTIMQVDNHYFMYSRYPIAVNVNRVYRVTVRVRQTKVGSDSNKNKLYAGVVTLDKDLKRLTGGAGTHRYCAVSNTNLRVEDGWQIFTGLITGTGATHDTFREGTKFVRPMILVNYDGGNGTSEIDYVDFEDVTEIQGLTETVSEVEFRTTENSIISTVTESQQYQNALDSKADASEFDSYISEEGMSEYIQLLEERMDVKIDDLDLLKYVTQTELEQTASELDFKFTSSGGVNLIKNSVGFSDFDFWELELSKDNHGVTIGTADAVQNAELAERSVGSGFRLRGGRIEQEVPSSAGQQYTLSWILSKNAGTNVIVVIETGSTTIRREISQAYDYERFSQIIEAESNSIKIVFYGGTASTSTVTGIMLNIGNVPLQWQHSAGEVYNTNVLMDLNGIRVIADDFESYTSITPTEFAGYANVNGNMERIFSLNGDTTQIKKASIESELDMKPIKAVPITSGTFQGWAFIKSN